MRQCIVSACLDSVFIIISDLIRMPVTSCPLADQCLLYGWVVPSEMFEVFLENVNVKQVVISSVFLRWKASSVQQPVLICFSLAQMDLCIEAFGTSKQKRALNSRRMNAVGNDTLNTAVTKAAANVIDAKGVTGKNIVSEFSEGNQKCLFLSDLCQVW